MTDQAAISSTARRLLLCSAVPGVGKIRLSNLARDGLFFKVPLEDLHEVYPEFSALRPGSSVWVRAQSYCEQQIAAADQHQARILGLLDSDFPSLLRKAPQGTPLLFVKGNTQVLSQRVIGIIGTREPTAHGIETARRMAAEFGQRQWSILSGLATGIDTAAHTGAVESNHPSVGVLAQGLESIYPKSNSELAARMVDQGGALVSEFAFGSQTHKGNFVERDYTQAALSIAIMLVQTGITGGSLHACRSATKLRRHVVVVNPTKRDATAGEDKIRGNTLLIEGSDVMKAELLQCKPDELTLLTLSSKEQYGELDEIFAAQLKTIMTPPRLLPTEQPSPAAAPLANQHRVDQIVQFVVLLRGQEDNPGDRQLGPIHILKFVYLADLEYARDNGGQTFTSIDWKFHKFGPWSPVVHQRIPAALKAINADGFTYESSREDREDCQRWSKSDETLFKQHEKDLPFAIRMALSSAVHRYGKDTESLLDYVYKTEPMLRAAPGELLRFDGLISQRKTTSAETPSARTERQDKKLRAKMKKLREQLEGNHSKADNVFSGAGPRFDDVHREGQKLLDDLGGSPFQERNLTIEFSGDVWKSPARNSDEVS